MLSSRLFERLFELCLCALLLPAVFCSAQSSLPAAPAASTAGAPVLTPVLTPVLNIDGLGKGSAALDGTWQFHLGDDPSFAQSGIDDATGHNGWEALTTDAPWGMQGHFSYAGFGWYRKHITLSTAPGAPGEIALLIPQIDDAYELYWDGIRIGGMGSMPPHLDYKVLQPQQTYGLGPIRSGVLAVRVYKVYLSSIDDGTAGGFEATPTLGSPQAIALLKTADDYSWLQHLQTRFVLCVLYTLTALISFIAWLRDRKQKLLLWVAVYTATFLSDLFTGFMRVDLSAMWLNVFAQLNVEVKEISLWFLLFYLLRLEDSTRLRRLLLWSVRISLVASLIDSLLNFFFHLMTATQYAWLDAVLTVLGLGFGPITLVIVAVAFFRRHRLDHTRWLVGGVAAAYNLLFVAYNLGGEGVRYTHWDLVLKIASPFFRLFGSDYTVPGILQILLFLAIIYAVVRQAIEQRKRQAAIEQEVQAARELQQVLVPETLPDVPGYTITSAYQPAQEVGGDFFQIIPIEGEQASSTLIVLGDVSGKGLKAAMTVSLIVGAIRTIADTTSSPAEILFSLNRRLTGRMRGGFATCVALRIDANGLCTLASAGHPSPFLNHSELQLPNALPLGIVSGVQYEELAVPLNPNDYLALYTDGLLEARSATGDLFSFERLVELFRTRPSATAATQAAITFGQDDDITVVTLSRAAVLA